MDFCYKVGLPITLNDMNIKAENIMVGCEKACVEGETIHNVVGEINPERLRDFVLTADVLVQDTTKNTKILEINSILKIISNLKRG